MQIDEEGLKQELIDKDDEFRRLYEEHQNYERRLDELGKKAFVSPADQEEVKQIKLHKLTLKDRMASILRSHREAQVSA